VKSRSLAEELSFVLSQENEVEGIGKIGERGKGGEVEGLFRWDLGLWKNLALTESLSLLCAIDPAFEV